jgi:hypothetical protein
MKFLFSATKSVSQFSSRRVAGAAVGGDVDGEDALARLTVGLLVAGRDALDAEDFDGLLHVAVGLGRVGPCNPSDPRRYAGADR